MSDATREFYAQLEVDGGFVWIQVRAVGARVRATEAAARAGQILEAIGGDIATIHPLDCRIVPGPGQTKGGVCDCDPPRWIRRDGEVA